MRRRGWGRPQGRRAGATCQSEERTPHACCPTGDCRACVRSAAAVILVGAMTAFPSPSPWSRPDDAVRQAQLDAMKRQATGLLALAGVVFVGASLYEGQFPWLGDRKSTRLNSSHVEISYAVFCLKKKKNYAQHVTRLGRLDGLRGFFAELSYTYPHLMPVLFGIVMCLK